MWKYFIIFHIKNINRIIDHVNIYISGDNFDKSGPTWNGPFEKDGIQSWCDKDPTLWEECLKERTEHDILIKKSKAKRHYCGHFHQYYFVDFDDCCSRIIAEFEIVQH